MNHDRMGVALIDLDRTLLDEFYQLTDPEVVTTIGRKKSEGWMIGLTSDTPITTLSYWYGVLGLNGPMVVEKGAAVWWPEDDAYTRLTKAYQVVEKGKKAILSAVVEMGDVMLVVGDATAFIRGVPQLPPMAYKKLLAYNHLREFSIAFHIRRIDADGKLVLDVGLAQQLTKQLQDHIPVSELLSDGELDPDYGFYFMNPCDVTKASGNSAVFDNYCKSDKRRVVIGDSMSDFMDGVEVLAVGNSHPEFKAVANKVARASYASGVKELLETL